MLVAGIELTNDDLAPLVLDRDVVEVFAQFKYLGFLVEACGGVVQVSCRIAQAFRTFGSPHDSGFTASETMETKRMVYQSVVLVYSTEAWAPTQDLVGKLPPMLSVQCIWV